MGDAGSSPAADEKSPPIPAFARGAIGGIASGLLLQPLDVLKSRQQYHAATHREVRPLRQIVTGIVRTEGPGALWNGLSPTLIRVGFGVGLYFSTLDALLEASQNRTEIPDSGGFGPAVIAGGAARMISCAVVHPVSVVKTRMESYKAHKYTGTFGALRTIARTERLPGLYAGFAAALVRDVPFSAAYVASYQQLLLLSDGVEVSGPIRTFTAGFGAGVLATMASHPFDVVKTRLQLDRIPPEARTHGQARTWGTVSVIKSIYALEGSRGLWRGVAVRLAKRPLASAVVWTIFEGLGAGGVSDKLQSLR